MSEEDIATTDPNSPDFGSPDLNAQIEAKLNQLWSDPSHALNGPRTGNVIGDYRIRSALGSGAFAIVYLADDLRTHQPVALKIPRPEILIDPLHRQRFVSEAIILKRIDHPNIIKIYDVVADAPTPLIAMEWCHGPDLGKWLELRSHARHRNWRDAVAFIADVAQAVHHVHQLGITHRDLKPANILLEPKDTDDDRQFDGRLSRFDAKVSDFGLAKSLDVSLAQTRSSLVLGTPLYMAPEQFNFDESSSQRSPPESPAIDIYSIGAILFELLTGRPPVEGNHFFDLVQKLRHSSTPRLRNVLRDSQPAAADGATIFFDSETEDPAPLSKLETICSTCLHKNPAGRYPNAAALAEDLRNCLAGQSILGQPLKATQKYTFWHTSQKWPVTAWRFAITFSTLISMWVLILCIAAFFFQSVDDRARQSLIFDTAMILSTVTIPISLLGWFCPRNHRLGILAAIILSVPSLIAASSGLIGTPLAFKEFYQSVNPFVGFEIHLFIFFGYALQVLLFSFALPKTAPLFTSNKK